jgi:hypothetical protein
VWWSVAFRGLEFGVEDFRSNECFSGSLSIMFLNLKVFESPEYLCTYLQNQANLLICKYHISCVFLDLECETVNPIMLRG